MRKTKRRISMCTKNTRSDIVSGNDLYDFKIRRYYESIMEPIILEKLNLHLDLQPHVDRNDLKVCFYDFPYRVKLCVPVHLSFSVPQMLERIYEQYEKDLPSLTELISSSECISCGLTQIRQRLNRK